MRITDGSDREDSEAVLRQNIQALMDLYRWNQAELAARIGKDQSWVSRHLSGAPPPRGARFQFRDLDLIAHAFGLSPADLLRQTDGNWDRRNGRERRSGRDRRRGDAQTPFHPREYPRGTNDSEDAA